jgi:transposase InsO family protein
VWARLRVREVRTSMRRVLRLMRENDLLAPQRQPRPVEPKRHDGTILAERPNPIWGIDATVGFTLAEGRVAIFAMVDHAMAESRAFTSPSAARGLRRWNRSARRCVNSSVVLQKTSPAA